MNQAATPVWLQPHPIITLGRWHLYSHGLFFALAAIVSTLLFLYFLKRHSLPLRDGWERAAAIFALGVVGARLGFVLTYPDQIHSLSEAVAVWHGGLVSYWGIGVALVAAALLLPKPRLAYIDWLAVAGLFAWAIGRWGNYYAADSVGVTSSVWSLFYNRVPIQLFESALTLLLGLVWVRWFHSPRPGLRTLLAIGSYGFGRFFIDIWRDERSIGVLHVSQYVDATIFFVAALILCMLHYADRQE